MSKWNAPSRPRPRPDEPRYDVAVLGGGPAGAATAIALVGAGRSVVVLEKTTFDRVRIGETLPPVARLPLARLGVWETFIADRHVPSPGIRSVWGDRAVFEQPFVFNPYGHGWHLDRQHFDTMLAGAADKAGARLHCGVAVTSCSLMHGAAGPHRWRIDFGGGGAVHRLRARFVVDATGRTASLARRQGAHRIASDRLVGLAAIVGAPCVKDALDGRTLVEATDQGWWYSAVLPDARMIAVYMTDADRLPPRRPAWPGFWRARLRGTTATMQQLRVSRLSSAQPASVQLVSANSSWLDRTSGRGWLAAGDAAMAFDPLSSQGIVHALTSGLRAGEVVHRWLEGDRTALGEYDDRARRTFSEYRRLHAIYYGRERRWPDSVFWRRRHQATSPAQERLASTPDAPVNPAIRSSEEIR